MTTSDHAINDQRPAPPKEIHLSDLWAVVLRRWKLVALFAVLVVGGAYVSGRNAVALYQSRLTVQIASAKQVFARTDDIDIDELALRTDPILSEALVLTTQDLALRVVRALNLRLELQDPELFRGRIFGTIEVQPDAPAAGYVIDVSPNAGRFTLRSGDRVVSEGTLDAEVTGPGFALRLIPEAVPRERVAFNIVRPEVAAAWVSAGVGYRVRDATNAVDISFTGTDPTLIPLVLNQAALELRRSGVSRAVESASRKREYVAEQLDRANESFQVKLAELQRFKEQHRITDLGTEERAIIESIRELERQRQEIRMRVTALQGAAAGHDSISVETLNRLAAVDGTNDNAVLAYQINRLLELYHERRALTAGMLGLRENNPQVEGLNQRIRDAHASLRTAVDAALQRLKNREAIVDEEIADLRRDLLTYPGKQSEIAQLQLETSILNDTYRYLLGQFEQARLQEATIAPYVTILDGASPAGRIGSDLRQKLILGLLVGLLLGLGAAFFVEYLDQTVKTAADVERLLGIPVLGLIPREPRLASGNGHRATVTVLDRLTPNDPAVEAFRALRTNVTFVGAEKPVQALVVTSPGPDEGKSTTAANLALMLAQGGDRTLLIDGDLRRPTQHRAFTLVQEPGLTDVLVGRASAREAIRPNVAEHLDLLPAGPTPPNPAELLGSEAMRKLVGELRRDYRYLILDTPPSLPVTDAAVASAVADATILVMRSGETEETAARRATDQLRRLRVRVAGAVLNAVSRRYDSHYSYYANHPGHRSRSPLRALKSKLAGL